jgi:hypothetical protein
MDDGIVASFLTLFTKATVNPPHGGMEEVDNLEEVPNGARDRVFSFQVDELVEQDWLELLAPPHPDHRRR